MQRLFVFLYSLCHGCRVHHHGERRRESRSRFCHLTTSDTKSLKSTQSVSSGNLPRTHPTVWDFQWLQWLQYLLFLTRWGFTPWTADRLYHRWAFYSTGWLDETALHQFIIKFLPLNWPREWIQQCSACSNNRKLGTYCMLALGS